MAVPGDSFPINITCKSPGYDDGWDGDVKGKLFIYELSNAGDVYTLAQPSVTDISNSDKSLIYTINSTFSENDDFLSGNTFTKSITLKTMTKYLIYLSEGEFNDLDDEHISINVTETAVLYNGVLLDETQKIEQGLYVLHIMDNGATLYDCDPIDDFITRTKLIQNTLFTVTLSISDKFYGGFIHDYLIKDAEDALDYIEKFIQLSGGIQPHEVEIIFSVLPTNIKGLYNPTTKKLILNTSVFDYENEKTVYAGDNQYIVHSQFWLIIHELCHALGFSDSSLPNIGYTSKIAYDGQYYSITDKEAFYLDVTSPSLDDSAIVAYNMAHHISRNYGFQIPIENDGGTGSKLAHWEEGDLTSNYGGSNYLDVTYQGKMFSIPILGLDHELMTPVGEINHIEPFSYLTLGILNSIEGNVVDYEIVNHPNTTLYNKDHLLPEIGIIGQIQENILSLTLNNLSNVNSIDLFDREKNRPFLHCSIELMEMTIVDNEIVYSQLPTNTYITPNNSGIQFEEEFDITDNAYYSLFRWYSDHSTRNVVYAQEKNISQDFTFNENCQDKIILVKCSYDNNFDTNLHNKQPYVSLVFIGNNIPEPIFEVVVNGEYNYSLFRKQSNNDKFTIIDNNNDTPFGSVPITDLTINIMNDTLRLHSHVPENQVMITYLDNMTQTMIQYVSQLDTQNQDIVSDIITNNRVQNYKISENDNDIINIGLEINNVTQLSIQEALAISLQNSSVSELSSIFSGDIETDRTITIDKESDELDVIIETLKSLYNDVSVPINATNQVTSTELFNASDMEEVIIVNDNRNGTIVPIYKTSIGISSFDNENSFIYWDYNINTSYLIEVRRFVKEDGIHNRYRVVYRSTKEPVEYGKYSVDGNVVRSFTVDGIFVKEGDSIMISLNNEYRIHLVKSEMTIYPSQSIINEMTQLFNPVVQKIFSIHNNRDNSHIKTRDLSLMKSRTNLIKDRKSINGSSFDRLLRIKYLRA